MAFIYTIYKITNLINGKVYIGLTRNSLAVRIRQHLNEACCSRRPPKQVIQRAIKKHGRENFRFEIVATGLSKKEAEDLEKKLIAEVPPELKYNVALGGEGTHGLPWTEERKRRQIATMKGRKPSEQSLAALRDADRSHYYKKVICLDDGLIYDSVSAAAAHYGIHATAICRICLGTDGKGKKIRLSTNGKHFAYYHEGFSDKERQDLIKIAEQKRKSAKEIRRRSVICLNDGKLYNSVQAAACAYNISKGSVSGCCRRCVQTISGLRFIYADQETPVAQKLPTKKPITNLTSGIVYKSGTDAAKAVGRSLTAVMTSIKLNRKCAGQRFAFAT